MRGNSGERRLEPYSEGATYGRGLRALLAWLNTAMTLRLGWPVRELANDENCSILLSGEESHPLGGGSERLLHVGRRLGSLIYGRKPEERARKTKREMDEWQREDKSN